VSIALAAGCATGPSLDHADVIGAKDSAVVRIIENHVPDSVARRMRLVETLRIGGTGSDSLDRVQHVRVDGAGSMVVVDRGRARLFDARGRQVVDFGAAGDLLSPLQSFFADEEIAFRDADPSERLVVFRRDGSPVSARSLALEDWSLLIPRAWTPRGWVVSVFDPASLRAMDEGDHDVVLRLMRPNRSGPGDTVRVLPWRWPAGPDGSGPVMPLFEAGPQFDFDGSGRMYLVAGNTFRIETWSADGVLLRVVTRDHDAIPIDPPDIDEVVALMREFVNEETTLPLSGRDEVHTFLEKQVRAGAASSGLRFMPPISELHVSAEGAIWVRRSDREKPALFALRRLVKLPRLEAKQEWDVFGPDGRYTATVQTPPRFTAMAAADRALYGVIRDERGIPYVVQLELRTDAR
jgi:hypothetical protein